MIRVVKTKALINCAVSAQLICGFVFAYAGFLVFRCGGSCYIIVKLCSITSYVCYVCSYKSKIGFTVNSQT